MTQTVLITGASSGIGAELARSYAREGARLVLLARRRDRLEQLAAEARAAGAAEVEVHEADITRDGDVARAVAGLQARGIGLDIVYANAGFGVAGMMQRLTVADYQRQLDTNVIGLLRTVYETLPGLRAARGRLVLVGSVAGHIASPGSSAYCMSKFAVRALAESFRGDLQGEGIGVTLVSPGFVASDIRRTDNKGVLRADAPDPIPAWLIVPTDRAVRSIVRAVRRGRPEIVVTGHGKVLVYISRHFPWLLRFLSARLYRGRPEPKSARQGGA